MSKPIKKLKTGNAVQHKAADYDSVLSGVVELPAIVLQLVIALAFGQLKVFEASEFNVKFYDLFEGKMGITSLRFASENLADKDREGVPVRAHGPVHDLDGQVVAKSPARD